MEIVKPTQQGVTVRLTVEELVAVNNALNEACSEIEDWEFSTRMGCELADAQALLAQVSNAIDAASAS